MQRTLRLTDFFPKIGRQREQNLQLSSREVLFQMLNESKDSEYTPIARCQTDTFEHETEHTPGSLDEEWDDRSILLQSSEPRVGKAVQLREQHRSDSNSKPPANYLKHFHTHDFESWLE